jgi:hypothetical protein
MSTVDYEVKNKIGYITLSRPDKLNAINVEMRQELGASSTMCGITRMCGWPSSPARAGPSALGTI